MKQPNDDDSSLEIGSLESAEKHSISLDSDRTLTYYTFPDYNNDHTSPSYPVLYLHGFPGNGLEAAVLCAPAAANVKLYALDRHGMGESDGFDGNNLTTPRERYEQFCKDVWDLAAKLEWSKFSIIGVSGGGPFACAILESYLSSKLPKNNDNIVLERVVLVAGVCCSAGVSDMFSINQKMYSMGSTVETSMLSYWKLRLLFGTTRWMVKIMPSSLMLKGVANKELPQVDQDLLTNTAMGKAMYDVLVVSLKNGSFGAFSEACTIFRPKQEWEDSLRLHYAKESNAQNLPRIHIFQGAKDKNVPLSHGKYFHETIFGGKSTFYQYDGLGHISLVYEKREEYLAKAVNG